MILAALVCVLHPVLALQQGQDWDSTSPMPPVVKRAQANQTHWKFTGTREVTFRRGADFSQHTEYVTRDGLNLRIDFPGGSRFSGQVIVETAIDRRRYDPKRNEIHVTPATREPLFDHIRGAWRGEHTYRVVEGPGQRVAGIPTRLVSVIDGAGNRIQELNVDPKFGVVLARRLYDDVGTQIRSFEYTEVNLHPNIDPLVFTLRRKGAKVVTPEDDLRREVHKTDFLPLVISPSTGLLLDSAHVRKIAGQPALMSEYISSKEKAVVILFQLSVGVDPKVLDRKAPKNVHTATAQIQGRWFVAVGILDESQLSEALQKLQMAR